ncbi:MAG: VWA domain-containing protein [Terriglobales bacterium]
MIFRLFSDLRPVLPASRKPLTLLALACCWLVLAGLTFGQDTSQPATTQQQPPANPNQQPAPPEAGGPQNDVGPYVIPKKKEEPPPPAPEKPKKIDNMPNYSLSVDVPLVSLDVLVTTKDGQTIPGLKEDNFKIQEDGTAQKIASFNQTQAPITAVLLVEFAAPRATIHGFGQREAYNYMVDALNASYTFAGTLRKDDWVAVESYDMKTSILVDFTQDKRAIMGALNSLRVPMFSERNLFDALFDTLDRLDRIEGKKYIILVSSGSDTFSKLTYDQALKKIKSTKDVTIYPISIGWTYREMEDAGGRAGGAREVGWLQNDNQMSTFAKLTGGRAYFPRFQGELPEIFGQISSDIRNQYTITYHPTNTKLDGTYRKLKVELQAPDGGPLKVRDQKGKEVKYVVYAREGYTAKHKVE